MPLDNMLIVLMLGIALGVLIRHFGRRAWP